jgi:CheY-like chemotaxis protein
MASVLVVENEVIVALDLTETLKALGYDVFGPAVSAEAACELARETRPDLIIMDVRLDGRKDGISAAEEITAEHPVKVIFLSAETDPVTRRRAAAVSPYAWLAKPCSPMKIKRTLDGALAA